MQGRRQIGAFPCRPTLEGHFYAGGRRTDGAWAGGGVWGSPHRPEPLAAQRAPRKGRFPVAGRRRSRAGTREGTPCRQARGAWARTDYEARTQAIDAKTGAAELR
jgi:hypothetical protein